MNYLKKKEILNKILGNTSSNSDELLYCCPSCKYKKPKLSINIKKNVYKCWMCDLRGSKVFYLVRRYGSPTLQTEWAKYEGNRYDISDFDELFSARTKTIQKKEKLELPKEYIPLINNKLPKEAEEPLLYLLRRGISKYQIGINKIGYCSTGEYEHRIIVPSFDNDGELDFFIGRTYNKNFFKYKNPSKDNSFIFNELYINWSKPIILVEGIFDSIKAGFNAIPLMGSSISENSLLFQKIVQHKNRVYVALDKDAKKKESWIIKKLLEYEVDVWKIDMGIYADPGEMSNEYFNKQKNNAEKINDIFQLYLQNFKNI